MTTQIDTEVWNDRAEMELEYARMTWEDFCHSAHTRACAR